MRHPAGILAGLAVAGAALLWGELRAQDSAGKASPAGKSSSPATGRNEDFKRPLVNRGEVPETEPENYVPIRQPETLWQLDGTMVVDRRATVMRHQASGWSLVTFEKHPSLPPEQPRWLLPNRLLEGVESIVAERPKQVFRVSGESTVYRNQLYLLLRKVTVEVAAPAPAPAEAEPAPKPTAALRTRPVERPAETERPRPVPSAPPKPKAPAATQPSERPGTPVRPAVEKPPRRPTTAPAPTSRPAGLRRGVVAPPSEPGRKRPSSDDVLRGLLKDRPGIPVIPPNVPPDESGRTEVPVERRPVEKPKAGGAAPAPSPGPDASGATTKPAERKPPSSEDVLKGLMKDRPGKPVIPPTDPAGPAPGAESVAPGAAEEVLPPGRGRMVTDRIVRILPAGVGVWQEVRFEADNSLREPPIRLLPCIMLERVLKYAAGGKTKVRISGEVTHYRGRRYMLLRKALRVRDLGAF